MTTFLAQVSNRILTKADRLFSNRILDVFIEILQNSRRAGSTLVDVTTSEVDGGTQIVFADNGSGIDDFSTLLHLGQSDWSSETDHSEDPAGIGFFSLIHSGVTVLSNGKRAVITKEAFHGNEPVELTEYRKAPVRGTILTFVRPEIVGVVAEELSKAVKYGSTEVMLNGTRLERVDFLSDAVHVKEINGVRLGVFRGAGYWGSNSLINFHGLVIGASGCGESSRLDTVLIPKSNHDEHAKSLCVSVDVLETTRLRLKLPDRSAVVQDDHFEVLKRNARIVMFEYLATLPEHQASYKLYQEAHTLGIDLKEATPYMRSFAVMPYDSQGNNETIDGCNNKEEVFNPAECALVDLSGDASDSDDPSFTFDVGARFFETLPLTPLQERSEFKGYSWYNQLPRYTRFNLHVDGKPCAAVETNEVLTLVDSIRLSFVLRQRKAGSKAEKIVWNLPFAGSTKRRVVRTWCSSSQGIACGRRRTPKSRLTWLMLPYTSPSRTTTRGIRGTRSMTTLRSGLPRQSSAFFEALWPRRGTRCVKASDGISPHRSIAPISRKFDFSRTSRAECGILMWLPLLQPSQ